MVSPVASTSRESREKRKVEPQAITSTPKKFRLGVAKEVRKDIQIGQLPLPRDKLRCKAIALLASTKLTQQSCIQIERAMIRKYVSTSAKEYKTKLRSLKFNLGKNEELRERIDKGVVEGDTLLEMTTDELMNESKKRERSKAQQEIFDESRSDWLDQNREKMNKVAGIKTQNGLFKCYRCKSTKTTHYQKQTRSADEPMTVFVQCTSCGNRWRC